MERYQHCELRILFPCNAVIKKVSSVLSFLAFLVLGTSAVPLQLLIRTILFDKKAPPLGGAFFLVHFWGMRNLVLFVFTMLVLVRCGAPEQPTKTPDVNTSESIAVSIKDPIDSINNVLRDAPNNLEALEYRASMYLKRQNLKYAAADVSCGFRIGQQ